MTYKMKGFGGFGSSPVKQKKHDLGGVGKMYVDVSTQEGRDIVKRYQNTPTIRSSDPSRVTKNYKSSNIIKDFIQYMKIERGLSENSIKNYIIDVKELIHFIKENKIIANHIH